MALADEVLRLDEKADGVHFILLCPARVGAEMTYRTVRVNFDKQGVVVAVFFEADEVKVVARRLALGPPDTGEYGSRGHQLSAESLLISFLVHEAQHEDLAGYGVLYDGWHEAVHLVEVYIVCHFRMVCY